MKNELIIKKCLQCGAEIYVLKDCSCDKEGIKCCDEPMITMVPNTIEASFEKHIPTYKKVEDEIFVTVNHVMEKEHFIEWIAMVSNEKVEMIKLYPEQEASVRFKYIPKSTIYAYCNKHGLWSANVDF